MSLKQFKENDVYKNTIITHPHFEIKIINNQIYVNNGEQPKIGDLLDSSRKP